MKLIKQFVSYMLIILLIGSLLPMNAVNAHPVPDPCLQLEIDVGFWRNTLISLNGQLTELEKMGWEGYVQAGAAIGGTGGLIGGLIVGPMGALGASIGGAITGGATGLFTWLRQRRNLKKQIETAEKELEKAKQSLKDCRSNPRNQPGEHNHQAPKTDPTGSLSPYMNDSTYVSSGDTHGSHLSTTDPFQKVYWYVCEPGDSGLGTHISTDTGDGSRTDSYFSYTPSTSGTYTITAYTYFTNTISEPSYDITVSSY